MARWSPQFGNLPASRLPTRYPGIQVIGLFSVLGLYRWTVQKLTRTLLGRLRDGDSRLLLALMADDVHFRFLGQHSWAADYHSKGEVRAWLDRYRRARLELRPLEVVASGPPWNTVICTRFTDLATDHRGELVYENEGVLFDRLVWGRIREHISYEDTQRTVEFDKAMMKD